MLAAAVAVGVWRGPADAPQNVDSTPAAAPASDGQSANSGTRRAPANRLRRAAPSPVTPPTTQTPAPDVAAPANPTSQIRPRAPDPAPVAPVTTRNDAVIAAERSAREQLEAGNADLALRSVEQGLAVDANDAGLQHVLADIFKNAQARVSQASRAAEKAGPAAVSSKEFGCREKRTARRRSVRAKPAGTLRRSAGIGRRLRLYGEAAKVTAVPASPPANTAPPPVDYSSADAP